MGVVVNQKILSANATAESNEFHFGILSGLPVDREAAFT